MNVLFHVVVMAFNHVFQQMVLLKNRHVVIVHVLNWVTGPNGLNAQNRVVMVSCKSLIIRVFILLLFKYICVSNVVLKIKRLRSTQT